MAYINKFNRPKPQARVIDPEMERLAAMMQRSGMTDVQIADKVTKARGSTLSPSTVCNVRDLATTRPQNYTLEWIGWALGQRRVWVDCADTPAE